MLVAVLCSDRAPALLQAGLNRVYNQFWRHQLVYQHASMNCASISVDVLRVLGWDIPVRGPTSRLVAAGLPVRRREGSLVREGAHGVRLSDRGPDAPDAGRRV
jgi:hypothetical protein